MFASFRKHQHWIWLPLVVIIIISFVVLFSPSVNWSGGAPDVDLGSINGRPITREEYQRALAESEIRYLITYGQWSDRADRNQVGFNVENETYNRLLLIQKLKDLKVQIGTREVAQWVRDNRQQLGNVSIDDFVDKILPMKKLRESDLERYIAHEIGIRHLITLAGLPGKLVTLPDVEAAYRRENEPVSVELAFFSATNHLSNVVVNPSDLGTFYTNMQARYRLPERVQVSYLKFEATNYLADADQQMAKLTNLTQDIEKLYQQRGTNYYKGTNDLPMAPETAKEKIKEEVRQNIAVRSALRKANELLLGLETIQPVRAEHLEKLAALSNLVVKTTLPFDDGGPDELNVPAQFTRNAFKLSAEEPISPAVVAEDGVYVMALRARLPSENPSFESIRDKVSQDYRNFESRKLARQAALAFHQMLTNQLARGKSFSTTAAEAKIKIVAPAPFTLTSRAVPELEDRVDLSLLKNEASSMSPGKVSQVLSSREGNYIVHLKARLPVDVAKMKDEMPEYLQRLRQARQFDAFNEWFMRQAEQLRLIKPKSASSSEPG